MTTETRRPDQPSAYDFRTNSTDATVISLVKQVSLYGLIDNWSRKVMEDEKVMYTVHLADGTSRTLKPSEMRWMLGGMINAYRVLTDEKVRVRKEGSGRI